MAEWSGVTGDISFQLNTDYFDSTIGAQEITALVSAWQAGALSSESLFYSLQQGEVVQAGLTYEEEQARIQSAPPASSGMML
jgi:hypothetical protein